MKALDPQWLLSEVQGKRLYLFLDFDGTIASHKPDGRTSVLYPGVREAIETLARAPRTRVCVVSGRPIADLHARIGLDRISLAGNHGLDIRGGDKIFIHPFDKLIRGTIQQAAEILKSHVTRYPRAILDCNGLSMSLNIGMVPRGQRTELRRIVETLRPQLQWLRLRIEEGHLGWDIMSEAQWNKGDAVAHLLHGLPVSTVVAIGDGLSDEPMFKVVEADGISIRVGASADSAARFFLKSVREVSKLLANLARDRTSCNT